MDYREGRVDDPLLIRDEMGPCPKSFDASNNIIDMFLEVPFIVMPSYLGVEHSTFETRLSSPMECDHPAFKESPRGRIACERYSLFTG